MEFVAMRDKLIEHFNKMTKNVYQLFEVNVDKDELWNLYLDSFPYKGLISRRAGFYLQGADQRSKKE